MACNVKLCKTIIILDISSPDNPQLIAQHNLDGTYIHDVYVRDNIAYCSSGNDGLCVWNLTINFNPLLIATLETNGFNHSNWLSEDRNTLIVAEEVPHGLPLLMIDATNLIDNDLTLQATFVDPTHLLLYLNKVLITYILIYTLTNIVIIMRPCLPWARSRQGKTIIYNI